MRCRLTWLGKMTALRLQLKLCLMILLIRLFTSFHITHTVYKILVEKSCHLIISFCESSILLIISLTLISKLSYFLRYLILISYLKSRFYLLSMVTFKLNHLSLSKGKFISGWWLRKSPLIHLSQNLEDKTEVAKERGGKNVPSRRGPHAILRLAKFDLSLMRSDFGISLLLNI